MISLGLLALFVFYASLLLVTSTASAGSPAIRGARRIRGASDQRKIIYISPLGSRSVLEDQPIPAPKTAPKSTLEPEAPVEAPPTTKPPAKTKTPKKYDESDDESIPNYSTQQSSEPSFEPYFEPSSEPDELIIAQIVGDVSIGEASPMVFGTGGIAAVAGAAGLVLIFLIVHLVGKFVKEDKSVKSKEEDFSPKSICLDTALREAANAEQPFDLSGTFILVENHNFEAFLEAQGVPWALRSAANRTRPLHRITHKGNLLIIKFKGIPQTTYVLNGPTVPSAIRGRLFEDAASYTAEKDGVQILKQSVEENYTIRLYWRLSEDKSTITLTLTVDFHDEREPVESIQMFERVESKEVCNPE
jgi:hypothetical protein